MKNKKSILISNTHFANIETFKEQLNSEQNPLNYQINYTPKKYDGHTGWDARCKSEDCCFHVHLSFCSKSSDLFIKHFNKHHSCNKSDEQPLKSSKPKDIIADYKQQLKDHHEEKPKKFSQSLKEITGKQFKYDKVRRLSSLLHEVTTVEISSNYSKLGSYALKLQSVNPRLHFILHRDGQNRFKRFILIIPYSDGFFVILIVCHTFHFRDVSFVPATDCYRRLCSSHTVSSCFAHYKLLGC